jgi:hypothetical protein
MQAKIFGLSHEPGALRSDPPVGTVLIWITLTSVLSRTRERRKSKIRTLPARGSPCCFGAFPAQSLDAMELRHVRYLVAVGQTFNFTKAAMRLHLAQPALSR